MRRENNTGSITRCRDRRRKPYKVTISTGYRWEEETQTSHQTRKVLGYFRTRPEAEDALTDWRRNPYDVNTKKITFAEVYEKWETGHSKKISVSQARKYQAAYSHLAPLHEMQFAEIRPHAMDKCIAEADIGSATKEVMKTLLSQLYKYALKNEIVTTNYSEMLDAIRKDAPQIIRTPFTRPEEDAVWEMQGDLIADMILVGIYSGWRPGELCLLESSAVDLSERTMKGGLKTAAGKGRIVPIHDKVLPIIKRRLNDGRLFHDRRNTIQYNAYNNRFRDLMDSLGTSHYPHDTRHSFVTKAKEHGMDEHILKLIVGHAEADLTERVYTHRGLEQMRREMAKIP